MMLRIMADVDAKEHAKLISQLIGLHEQKAETDTKLVKILTSYNEQLANLRKRFETLEKSAKPRRPKKSRRATPPKINIFR